MLSLWIKIHVYRYIDSLSVSPGVRHVALLLWTEQIQPLNGVQIASYVRSTNGSRRMVTLFLTIPVTIWHWVHIPGSQTTTKEFTTVWWIPAEAYAHWKQFLLSYSKIVTIGTEKSFSLFRCWFPSRLSIICVGYLSEVISNGRTDLMSWWRVLTAILLRAKLLVNSPFLRIQIRFSMGPWNMSFDNLLWTGISFHSNGIFGWLRRKETFTCAVDQ